MIFKYIHHLNVYNCGMYRNLEIEDYELPLHFKKTTLNLL